MVILDAIYIAIAVIGVMALLQFVTFIAVKLIYPPEPKIIYRDVPIPIQQPPPPMVPPVQFPPMQAPSQQNGPALSQQTQEVQLPEYEPRKPASDSLRVDPQLPFGLQETRPPGT